MKTTNTVNTYKLPIATLFAQHIILSLAGFLFIVAITRILIPEVYGELKFAMTLLSIAAAFILPGLGNTVQRFAAQGKKIDLYSLVQERINSSWLVLLCAILITLIVFFYTGSVPLWYIVAAFSAILLEAYAFIPPYLKGIKKFGIALKQSITTRVVQILSTITGAIIFQNPYLLFFVFVLSQYVVQLFYFITTPKEKVIDPLIQKKLLKQAQSFSTSKRINVLTNNIDKIAVGIFLGPVALAVYTVVLTIPLEVSRILNAIPEGLYPFTADGKFVVKDKSFLILYFSILLGVTTACLVLTKIFFGFIFPAYGEYEIIALGACVILLINPLRAFGMSQLEAQGEESRLLIIRVIELTILATAFAGGFLTGIITSVESALVTFCVSATLILIIQIQYGKTY